MFTRRHTLRSLAGGGLQLPGLLSEMMHANPLAPRQPHFPANSFLFVD